MYGYIYITTNKVNGKIYIGQHKASKFEPEKYIGSGTRLTTAITKYGKENFTNTLLCECTSPEELNEKEIYFINLYNSDNPEIGYNITSGGQLNPATTTGFKWINNGTESKSVPAEEVEMFLKNGYKLGRLITAEPWNKNRTLKESGDKSLLQISEVRKQKIASGEIRCCYGLKGEESPNYKTVEDIISDLDINQFLADWWELGKCTVAKKYHMRTYLVDRLLDSLGIEETKEHHLYIYQKGHEKRKQCKVQSQNTNNINN